ncbi:MAG: histidine phosphatase family protein [Nocardioides sp.]|nr:histidine phosphatase family protein [Nocardioides sp.]
MPTTSAPTTTRTLVIMRHAKAEQSGPTDAERLLASRGLADATVAGAWLAGQGITPDAALVSAATRTQMTWDAVCEAAGWDVEAVLDEGLYDAGPETALDLVRAVGPAVTTLLLIGHNPTVSYLAQLLDDGEGDDDASTRMTIGFPTCALAVLTFEGDWAELDEASASVVSFRVGRA